MIIKKEISDFFTETDNLIAETNKKIEKYKSKIENNKDNKNKLNGYSALSEKEKEKLKEQLNNGIFNNEEKN